MKNKDIFGVAEKKDKTAVAPKPVESLPDAHEGEAVGNRPLLMKKELKRRVIHTPFGRLQSETRKDVEAVEPPKEMPNNAVEPPKKKKEE